VKYISLNRTHVLIITTVLLLLFAVIYHVWADWGLITIHAKGMPLGKVIASMERQGHARIQTDLSLDIPVTMDVVKVHVPDALETLSTVTDSRWRLLYFVAGDKATLKTGETAWFGGQRPDGWTMVSFPFGNNLAVGDDVDPPVLDPREDLYTPKAAAPAPVQTYFTEAAQLTNAGFAFPTAWNPTVTKAPPAGIVNKSIPKLIGYAHGHDDELFFVSQNRRGGGPPRDGGGGNFGFNPDLFEERVQNEINRLPTEERTEAQNNFDSEKAFRASLKDMNDEQRREAFMAHMQDPAVQQMMANRQDGQDARMNHDQRMQRFSNYVNRKAAITGKM
jgi:hypothetical protein